MMSEPMGSSRLQRRKGKSKRKTKNKQDQNKNKTKQEQKDVTVSLPLLKWTIPSCKHEQQFHTKLMVFWQIMWKWLSINQSIDQSWMDW